MSTNHLTTTFEQRQKAEQFSSYHKELSKSVQIYFRTLAVYAVNSYVQLLGFETNLEASDSLNPVMQAIFNVSDLSTSLGKLECIPVLPGEHIVQVPDDSIFDRIGYVVVEFGEPGEVKLLGFTESVDETEEIHLSQLKSPDDLPPYLLKISQFKPSKTQVELNRWFKNIFEHGWQSFETFGFKQSDDSDGASVKGAKLIDLGCQSVLLLVAASEGDFGRRAIQAYVYPFEGTCVPPTLRLVLCSELGVVLQEVQSRNQDRCISLKREFDEEEVFSFQLVFEEAVVTETFVNNF